MFKKMRADLALMWSHSSKVGNSKRISSSLPLNEKSSISDNEGSIAVDEDVTTMKASIYEDFFLSFYASV